MNSENNVQPISIYESKQGITDEIGQTICSDLEVTMSYDSTFQCAKYQLSVEGNIAYETMQDGINYLKQLNNEFYNWMLEFSKIEELKKHSQLNNSDLLHINHEFKVYKNEVGYSIYLQPSQQKSLIDTYYWLNGAIKQLENIKLEGELQ